MLSKENYTFMWYEALNAKNQRDFVASTWAFSMLGSLIKL